MLLFLFPNYWYYAQFANYITLYRKLFDCWRIQNIICVGWLITSKNIIQNVNCLNFENKYDVQFKMSIWILKINTSMYNSKCQFEFWKWLRCSDLRIKIITLRNDDAPRNMIDSSVIICQRSLFTNLKIWNFRLTNNYPDLMVDNY